MAHSLAAKVGALILALLPACITLETKDGAVMFDDGDDSEMVIRAPDPKGISESKSGGWSASGILFRGRSLNTKVTLQAVFPVVGQYTLQFNTRQPTARVAGGTVEGIPTRTVALITWSVEGNYVTRRVNVGNGVSVTGVGQGVRVELYDATSGSLVTGSTDDSQYVVSVQVAPGGRGDIQEPPVLYPNPGGDPYDTVITAGSTADFDVPYLDAGIVSVAVLVTSANGVVITDQAVQVTQVQDNSISVFSTICQYDPRVRFWVPLVSGVDIIRVTNNMAVESIRANVLFGIDG